MASPINIINLDRGKEIDNERYKRKALINEKIFDQMYGAYKRVIGIGKFIFNFDGENKNLMRRLSEISGIDYGEVKSINIGDELMNLGDYFDANFRCTAIGREGVVGQTMDLYDLELSVIREGGALYVTFPPYLALMGMNKNIAFCTNFLGSNVGRGAPVSQIRKTLLRQRSLDDAVFYLRNVKKANSANFLLSDGNFVLDVETTRKGITLKEEIQDGICKYNAHTNHLIDGDIREDCSCLRLRKATKMLEEGRSLEEILDSDVISIPIAEGFGSIVKVIMDVKNGLFSYKDPRMNDYVQLSV